MKKYVVLALRLSGRSVYKTKSEVKNPNRKDSLFLKFAVVTRKLKQAIV